jgi:hypothetical protein
MQSAVPRSVSGRPAAGRRAALPRRGVAARASGAPRRAAHAAPPPRLARAARPLWCHGSVGGGGRCRSRGRAAAAAAEAAGAGDCPCSARARARRAPSARDALPPSPASPLPCPAAAVARKHACQLAVDVSPTEAAVGDRLCQLVAEGARSAIAAKGSFVLAVPGARAAPGGQRRWQGAPRRSCLFVARTRQARASSVATRPAFATAPPAPARLPPAPARRLRA